MKPVESIERDLNLTFQTYIPRVIKVLLEKECSGEEAEDIIKGLHLNGKMAKCIKSVVDASTIRILGFYYNIEQFGDGDGYDEYDEDREEIPF